MYEGNIVHAGQQPEPADAISGEEGLRALSWDEVVARLDAARDFRRLMEERPQSGGASFNAISARHLAALGDAQPGINPFALTNRKMANRIEFVVTRAAAIDDRGRQ
jgi:hypothetical protein